VFELSGVGLMCIGVCLFHLAGPLSMIRDSLPTKSSGMVVNGHSFQYRVRFYCC